MMQKTLSREAIASVVAIVSFAVGAVETPPQIFKPGRGSPKLRTSLRAVMPAIPDAKWTKGWWMPRHEQKLAEIRKIGNPKVVFLGDSITHFWEDSGRGLRTWNKYFTNETYRAVNLGFSGDRTEHVLWRIAHGELDGYQAKAVVLMLGTNNTGHFPIEKEPPEATILGMQAVVRAIRAKQPQAKLVICAIFPCDEKADGQRRLRNEIVNKEIQKLADGRNVFWLDFTTSFLTADGELLGEIMPDRLHPAAHGYEIWANAVLPYLNHALTAKDGEELLFPSTFAPRVKSEVTGAHTVPAIPMATFGMRWWGEFADRPLETMKKIADNPVVQVDENGVTNRWFDVVMVGDSITHRWERSGCGGEETWALLTNRYAVLNLGYGGDSTEHCLWRMKYGELYGYKAKLFTVMIGTNNNSAPGTSRGIEAVVRTIREIHPESKVVVLDIFPRNATADDPMRRKCAEISAEARKHLGDKDPNVIFLDLNAKFLEPDGTLTREMFPDLLHPAAKGYRAWYDGILPTIRELVGK